MDVMDFIPAYCVRICRSGRGVGSGILLAPCQVLTCWHVADNASWSAAFSPGGGAPHVGASCAGPDSHFEKHLKHLWREHDQVWLPDEVEVEVGSSQDRIPIAAFVPAIPQVIRPRLSAAWDRAWDACVLELKFPVPAAAVQAAPLSSYCTPEVWKLLREAPTSVVSYGHPSGSAVARPTPGAWPDGLGGLNLESWGVAEFTLLSTAEAGCSGGPIVLRREGASLCIGMTFLGGGGATGFRGIATGTLLPLIDATHRTIAGSRGAVTAVEVADWLTAAEARAASNDAVPGEREDRRTAETYRALVQQLIQLVEGFRSAQSRVELSDQLFSELEKVHSDYLAMFTELEDMLPYEWERSSRKQVILDCIGFLRRRRLRYAPIRDALMIRVCFLLESAEATPINVFAAAVLEYFPDGCLILMRGSQHGLEGYRSSSRRFVDRLYAELEAESTDMIRKLVHETIQYHDGAWRRVCVAHARLKSLGEKREEDEG